MRRRWQGRVANAGDIPIRAPETAVQAVPLVRVPLPGVVTGMGKRRSDDAHEETLAGRGERRVVRLLRLVTLLQRRKRGLRLAELITEFNVTRQTIYKYLDDVEAAGVPLDRAARHGEAWVKLDGDWLTPPGAAELFALVVARQALQGLPGSAAHQWLTPRLRELTTPRITVDAVAFAGVGAAEIEHALINDKRLRIDYRGLKDDEPKSRVIEPIELRFSQRAWYVFALDVDRQEPRTFKLARITRAVALDDHRRPYRSTRTAPATFAAPRALCEATSDHRCEVVDVPLLACCDAEGAKERHPYPRSGCRTRCRRRRGQLRRRRPRDDKVRGLR